MGGFVLCTNIISLIEHLFRTCEHLFRGSCLSGLCTQLRSLSFQRTGFLLGIGAFAASTFFISGTRGKVLIPGHVVHIDLSTHCVKEPDFITDSFE